MGQVVKHLKNKLVSSHYFTLLIAPVNAYASATNVIAVEYSSVTCLEILEY